MVSSTFWHPHERVHLTHLGWAWSVPGHAGIEATEAIAWTKVRQYLRRAKR